MRRLLTILVLVARLRAPPSCSPGASEDDSSTRSTRSSSTTPSGWSRAATSGSAASRPATTSDLDVTQVAKGSYKAVVTAEITEPGFGDFREDASCEIKPQSLIGEYYVDCQPGSSETQARERRHGPGRADRLDDPAGPREQHPAPALPRAAADHHLRARHRPGRAARRTWPRCCAAPIPACARPAGC